MFTWLTSLSSALGAWMFHPLLAIGGALLIASPIIIHLLNRQRYKTIDWAAMEFLILADKKNRRRVRLEDLLILLLRCLAILLIALLLSRPFQQRSLTGGLLETVRYERVVLLDDSLSMTTRLGSRSAMDDAKDELVDFVRSLAADGKDESITLLLTSQPDEPIFQGRPLNDATVDEIVRDIEGLEVTDGVAELDAALAELEKAVSSRAGEVNRVVYVVGDLRSRDWNEMDEVIETDKTKDDAAKDDAVATPASTSTPAAILKRLSRRTNGCYVIDVGHDKTNNLVIVDIVPQEKALVAGVATRLEVVVANVGREVARDVTVKFTAGDSIPLTDRIESIPPGTTESVPFTFMFALPEEETDKPLEPVRIVVEATAENANADYLQADNVRYYAARVIPGIPTLLVDGDPSARRYRSESSFLERSLIAPGEVLSGVSVDVVTDNEFETVDLQRYQVIFLCNLYRITPERREALEKWVRAGGGLVIALGDQIDEELYNEELYQDGKGLLPLPLAGLRGDETERSWAFFHVESENHPMLRIFAGENNPFIEGVKVFRWWGAGPPAENEQARLVKTPARFTDDDDSPAVVERPFGDGRVVMMTTAIDGDWSTWPADPSYLVAMQQLARYMARKSADEGNFVVGGPVHQAVNLTRYRMEVSLTSPDGTATPLQPMPGDQPVNDEGETDGAERTDETLWRVDYAAADRRGFYELALAPVDGGTETVLFAANVNPSEGDLKRIDRADFRKELGDAPVDIVSGRSSLALKVIGARRELWPLLLTALVVVLCGEQFLAWLFGRRR